MKTDNGQGPRLAREPRYVALTGMNFIEADDTLAALLAALQEIVDPTVPEDVAVWDGFRLVCLVRPGGEIVWLHQPRAVGA